MGRRRLRGATRSYPQGGSARSGYDFAAGEIQADRGRVTTEKEPDQGQGAGQGEASFSHSEARLRIRECALPGLEEEPRSPVRRLRASELIQAPQAAGPAGGVVCPQSAENTLCGQKTRINNHQPRVSDTKPALTLLSAVKHVTCSEVP